METEGSLPCSQDPATGLYSELHENSPQPTKPIYLKRILILSSNLRLGLPSGLVPSCLPTTILYAFLTSPVRAICLAHLILLNFITLTFGEEFKL